MIATIVVGFSKLFFVVVGVEWRGGTVLLGLLSPHFFSNVGFVRWRRGRQALTPLLDENLI